MALLLYPRYYGWGHVTNALKTLCDNLNTRTDIKQYQHIYALGRGGMIPARLLSGKLKIKNVGYIGNNWDLDKMENSAIICDDIFDTGKTHQELVKKLIAPDMKIFAFLFIRSSMVDKVSHNVYYGMPIYDQSYIVFPWEASETD